LWAAWQRVAANQGAAGIDRISIERFEAHAERYLTELAGALRDNVYQPSPVRRVHIPKGNGKTRPLGIATVKDRVVQTALKLVLELILEKEFLPVSFGFRPGRSCKKALRVVDQALKDGYTWVVDADLQSYFDTIPKQSLLEQVSDGRVLALVRSFLDQDVMEGLKRWTPTAGTAQGSALSPLLSNLYLHGLDELMSEAGVCYARFADDFVALCRTRHEAEAVLTTIQAWVEEHGLHLHPGKTRVGNCLEKGQGFEFLGYRFEAGKRWVRRKAGRPCGTRSGKRPAAREAAARKPSSWSSIPSSRVGLATSNTPIARRFGMWTALSDAGCGHSCVSGPNARALLGQAAPTAAGLTPSSLRTGFSPYTKPMRWRADPDEETTDWRAVCGRTARTVGRAGGTSVLPDPYLGRTAAGHWDLPDSL